MLSGAIMMLLISSCKKDEKYSYFVGNPIIEVKSAVSSANFGDSLIFELNASDVEIPLSTVKVQLYFTDEMVSETVIRTKENGDYSGKIFVPFLQNVPNGKATLKFVLQNISQKITEQSYEIDLSRPDFPYLTFITATESYRMSRTGANQYSITENFPFSIKGYIQAPKVGEQGNIMNFGWLNNRVDLGSIVEIPFSNAVSGQYSIQFNTLTYEASPFIIAYAFNGNVMSRIDDNHFKSELSLSMGETIQIDGIEDLQDWWIDPDFFSKSANGDITFNGWNGKYRVTADFSLKYFIVEPMNGTELATLNADGTGAIWIIGEGIGKPNLLTNQVGWNTDKAISLSPIGNKKYQITLIAGESIHADNINFKFFKQKGWGGEFGASTISTTSDLIFVGNGTNGRDSGNLGILAGKTLELGKSYTITIDLSGGNDLAVLSLIKN